ncbi:MAG: VWA domain-containing protein [Fimbriimonadales bacterium]|nr:VWA domain-containing protein [Fimbriimonadales bacterium]
MNPTRTSNDHLIVEATLHEDDHDRLILFRLETIDRSDLEPAEPLRIALVIDRSGSMSGEKLEIAKQAALEMVRSLGAEDRVGVVVYDDTVDLLQELAAPGKLVASKISRVQSGGCTNLHGGWLRGVHLLPNGGHVVLLSDGLANAGLFTDAEGLANEAARARREHGVTTSTIGIGMDFDERLMARMADEGGGMHYFARTAASIRQAFENERFLMLSTSITDLEAEWPGGSLQIGRLIDGEVRHAVAAAPDPEVRQAAIRYTDAKTGEAFELIVPLPDEPTVEPLATAHLLARKVGDLMARTLDLHSAEAAAALHEEARVLREEIAAHPLATGELLEEARRLVDRLLEETDGLRRRFDAASAVLSRMLSYGRRRRMETSFYPLFAEGATSLRVSDVAREDSLIADDTWIREVALRLPKEEWRRLRMAPIGFRGTTLVVAAQDPRDGIALGELSHRLGLRVVSRRMLHSAEEIDRLLDELFREP